MTTNVLMPLLGEAVLEGTVSKWLKQEGDVVNEFDPLLEVNTDKVDTEIPAPTAGVVLKTLVPAGTTVKVGTVLAIIGQPGEAGAAPALPGATGAANGGAAKPVAASPAPAATPAARRELGFISPVVAKLADEYQVDLTQIAGTGLNSRITKKDVLAYVEQRQAQRVAPQPAAPQPTTPQITVPQVVAPPQPVAMPQPVAPSIQPAVVPAGDEDSIPVVGMRKLIAEHMVLSKHTSPHVTTVHEADLSRVIAHQKANEAAFARDGVKLTLTAYFMSAIVVGLKAVPIVNSQWATDKILLKREINIGMAVALEEGLIVPVLKHADEKSLLGLAREVNDLAKRARAKALRPDEVQGGTFTLTNHGVSGSLFATPVINQPQTGILGVGALQKRVVVLTANGEDLMVIRPMVYLGLTFDHRILDGAVADKFVATVRKTLENWA